MKCFSSSKVAGLGDYRLYCSSHAHIHSLLSACLAHLFFGGGGGGAETRQKTSLAWFYDSVAACFLILSVVQPSLTMLPILSMATSVRNNKSCP